MITISQANVPIFYAIFFLVIAGGMGWILRNFIQGVRSMSLPFVLPAPLTWQRRAWTDLGWKGGIHYYRSGPLHTEAAGVISRLTAPTAAPKRPLRVTPSALKATLLEAENTPGWLTYRFAASGLVTPRQTLTVQSSQHRVELAMLRTWQAALCTLAVHQRGMTQALVVGPGRVFTAMILLDQQPFGRFIRHDQAVHLVDHHAITLGVWTLSTQPNEKFGPDAPHVYAPLTVAGKPLAELIRPGNAAQARFKHEPFAPMVRNVRSTLTTQEEQILLAFVSLQIYCLSSGYHFGAYA